MKRFILLLFASLSLSLGTALAQPFTVTIDDLVPALCPGDCGISLATPTPAANTYTYLWNTGSAVAELFYCQSGTYTVTVTNAQGQTATASSLIIVPQNSVTAVGIKPACCAGSCTGVVDLGISNGTWPLSYLWSNGSTTEDLVACAGLYSVTVTDAHGCVVYVDQHTITQPLPIVTFTQVTPVGTNGAPGAIDLTVSGGTPPYSVSWSNGNFTPDLSEINQPGTYCFTVSDSRGCTKTDCVTMPTTGGPNTMLAITADIVHTCGTGQGNCSGSITPTVSGGSGQYLFTWTGPGGYTSTSLKPTGLCVGTYLLTVTDVAINFTSTASYSISPSGTSDPLIIQSSNSAFCNVSAGTGGKCQQLCPNARVSYFINPPVVNCNNIQQPVVKYVWAVNGAESWSVTPDTKRIDVVWGAAGSGDIFVQQEGALCIVSGTYCINILEEPKAQFSTSPALTAPADTVLEICKGQTVFFKNESLAADLFEWTFSDDASIETQPNPKHEYHQPGLFNVRLIARTQCLCADTTWLRVRVLDAESPLLNCINTLCPGEVVTYSTPSTCASYEWSISANGSIIGGGGMLDDSITVRWLSGPDGTLSLRALGCGGNVCPSVAVVQVPILSDAAEIRGPELVCPDAEEIYQISAFDGANYVWGIASADGTVLEGQGTPKVSIKWGKNTSSPRPLWVEYDNCYLGCKGRDTIWVKISPQFGIVGPVEACDNTVRTFSTKTYDNKNITCEWTLYAPDGTVAHQYTAPNQNYVATFGFGPGTYRMVARPIAAQQQNTCTSEAEWKVLVQANPQKPFGISGQTVFCPSQQLTYTAQGVNPSYDVRWQAQVASGTPIDGGAGNPKIFAFAGGAGLRWVAAYQVSANALACKSDTVRLLVKELGAVSVSGPDQICLNEVATYTAPQYIGFDYQWVISPANAGVIVKGQKTNTLEVQWVKPGSGTAELTVCGKKAARSTTIWPLPAPEVVHPDGLCPGSTATLSTTQPYASLSWRTAGGSSITNVANPALGPGLYLLAVTDEKGCKGSTDFQIDTLPVPNLTITTSDPTGFCNNERFVRIQALTNQDGNYHYEWFRDGTPLGLDQNTLVTNQYGKYSCRATNTYGCSATDGSINVFEFCGGVCHNPSHKPRCQPGDVNLSIVPTVQCDSFLFQVTGGPLYPPGTATVHFGESGSSYHGSATGDKLKFKFNNAGQYIIVLYAKLSNGAECTLLDSVDVDAVARFSITPACIGDSTRFQDGSTFLPDKGIKAWTWDLGDPNTPGPDLSTVRNPGYPFALPGPINVRLTVTANSGCTSTLSKTADIPFLPNDAFATVPTVCTGNATPLSWGESVPALTWDFGEAASGDKNKGSGSPAYHTYAGSGNYTVTATPRNAYGCTATYSRPVSIVPNTLSGNITPAFPIQICEGKTLQLDAPQLPGVSYLWSNNFVSPSITVGETGVYRVTLTSSDGCTYVPPARTLTVNPAPEGTIKALEINSLGQVTGVSFPTLTLCQGNDVTLKVEGNTTLGFSWSGGGGTDDLLQFLKERNNLLPVGTHTYSVTLTNTTTGCTAVTSPFTVIVNPTPSGFWATASSYCAGTPSEVKYMGPAPPPTWALLWNNGEAGPSFSTTEAGKYFVRVVNEFGCAANSAPVIIRPGPNVAALPGGCHSRCKPDTLCVPNLPGIASWQWYLNGSPVPGANSANFVAQQSGTYWAVLTDNTGCQAQSDDLYLDLYDGYGTLSGQVWSDVNANGLIDAADTLLAAIPLTVNQNGLPFAVTQSAPNGTYSFPNILSTAYTVLVNTALLPPIWEVIIGQRDFTLSGCGAFQSGDLLLRRRPCLPAAQQIEISTCAGLPVVFQGSSIAPGSSQIFTYKTLLGCDSTLTVKAVALPAQTSTLEAKICPGSTYTYGGQNLAVGTATDFTLKTAAGCDSVVTVRVSAFPTASSTVQASACSGGAFVYAGVAVAAGTSRIFPLTSQHGCDSLVTVTVAALPPLSSTFESKVCPGSTYPYGGQNLAVGTVTDFTLKTAAGCDSVVTVRVSALSTSGSALNVSACPGSSYTYAGVEVPTGTSQAFKLTNWLGCDSVVVVNVGPLPISILNLAVKTCPGTTYAYGGSNLEIGSTTTFKLTNWQGCDSLVTVTVGAYPEMTSSLQANTCPGSTYTYAGVALPIGTTQTFTLSSAHGCDSLVTVTVGEAPHVVMFVDAVACQGGYFTHQGQQIPAGTEAVFTQINAYGCLDSTIVGVSVLPPLTSALTLRTCPDQTVTYQNTPLAVGTVQDFLLKTSGGCDSVVTVTVAALPTSSGLLTLRVCPGISATYAGVDIPVGTSKEFRLSNWLGCDSVLTVMATELNASASALTLKTCPGTTAPYGGLHLPIGATQAFTLTNAAGCDSVVTVTVAALLTSAEVIEVNVCPGTTYSYAGTELAAGETRDFHFKNASDCDSVVTVRVSAWSALSFEAASVKSCATLANGSLTAQQLVGGTPPMMYSIDGLNYQSDSVFASLPPGNYTLQVRDANGCVFEKEAPVLGYGALSVELPDVVLPCGQPSVRLEPAVSGDLTGLAFAWSSEATTPTWEATEGGSVWVEVSNVCQKVRRTAAVHWGDLGDTSLVYMANAFKPVGALVENTVFKPQFAPGLTVLSYSLDVFDRWGNMVFRSQSPEAGWDGVFRDRLSDGDVYPWLLRARVLWCGREISIFKRGDVTAVR